MKELRFRRFSASFTVRRLISLSEPDFMKDDVQHIRDEERNWKNLRAGNKNNTKTFPYPKLI